MRGAAEALLLTKQLAGCTADTLRTYRGWLERYLEAGPELGVLAVWTFFAHLRSAGRPAVQRISFGQFPSSRNYEERSGAGA